jgi:hypothetical protein
MIRSLWDKGGKEESPQATAERPQDLTTATEEPHAAYGERTTTSVSPVAPDETLAEARLVPHHLLLQLRNYPRLRNLVLAYLLVQERFEWLAGVRTDLQRAGAEPDTDFWERLQRQFGGMGLRPEFPSRLLAGDDAVQEFADLVQDFDDRYTKVAAAAEAALNPNQSARSAREALEHVSAMRGAALKLIMNCRELAQTLLDDLYETVNMIFAGEGKPAGFDEKEKAIGRPASDLKLPGAARGYEAPSGRQKQVSGTGEGPDVHGHLLSSRREQHE